jgi:ATP/maltotriose-dependent transcriptional regulator MalT
MRRDWRAAYDAFTQAAEEEPLGTDDLDALAIAAWHLGYGKESLRLTERVFTQLARTDPPSAAMKAVELALAWLTRGDLNIAHGWMNRARRLLDGAPEGPTHGYLAYLDAVVAAMTHDHALADRVNAMRELRSRLDNPALTALGLVVDALAAIGEARIGEAYALVDEAMLTVVADQVPVEWAGDIYCLLLNQWHRLADFPRMHALTQSMERWCAELAASKTFGGVCDVHRLQLRAATDDYRELEHRLVTTSQALEDVNTWAAGEGYYQLGEVLRLRGDADGALAAFERARALGIDPQPGEALLHCQMGDAQKAWAEIRVALAQHDRLAQMRMLRGAVEIALARNDLDEADRYCRGLEEGAEAFGTPGFRAWAAHARGAVCVRQGKYSDALVALEAALVEYRVQKSRYETAQVYEWMALAHRGLGEDDVAAADIATAQSIYDELGVEPAGICGAELPGGLTKREIEILTAIAGGATNRQVAQRIFISEKTVARHLANIYTKLGVSSRTAAVAWAHEHNLLK